MKRTIFSMLMSAFLFLPLSAQEKPQGGADENTPSRSLFFSWINNTNEGATARQTQINLDFFKVSEWIAHVKYFAFLRESSHSIAVIYIFNVNKRVKFLKYIDIFFFI